MVAPAAVCAKCKQPCDETCAACKKGYVLHLRCMKPGDRLAVLFRRWRKTEEARHWIDALQFGGIGLLNLGVIAGTHMTGFMLVTFLGATLLFCGFPAAITIRSALDARRNRP